MAALVETEIRNELVFLAGYADMFPHAALSPVLALSVLPRVETAETFDRLRAALRNADRDAAEEALDALTGGRLAR